MFIYLWLKYKSEHIVATMTFLIVTEHLCHKWLRLCSVCRNHNPAISLFMTYHRGCKKSNNTGAISGAETADPSGALECNPNFSGFRVSRYLIFCVMFCRSLSVLFHLSFVLYLYSNTAIDVSASRPSITTDATTNKATSDKVIKEVRR
jgi:hypothetical protein